MAEIRAATDATFEELVLRRSDEADVRCPSCKSKKVARLISRTAAARTRGSGGAGLAPSCGPVG